ncbi:hypothetical protein JOM56_011041 [Amanita muscaria]
MTKKQWTTATQRTWMLNHLPVYLKAKEEKSTCDFFLSHWKLFMEQWPVEAPSAEEIQQADGKDDLALAKKKKAAESQFKTWFNNHTCATSSGTGTRQVLNLSATPKLVQPWQAYQNLYWEIQLREKAENAWKAYTEGFPEGSTIPLSRFAFRNQQLKLWYEESSDTTKAAVEAHRQVMKDKGYGADDKNCAYWQRSIDKLPRTLQTAAEALERQTGWQVTILAGGPVPRLGGQIQTLALHHGKMIHGKDFHNFLDDDSENSFVKYGPLMASFDNFLHASFSKSGCVTTGRHATDEMCQKRALIDDEEDDESSNVSDKEIEPSVGKEGSEPVCKYEKKKAENIARNNAMLAELGLSNTSETLGGKRKEPKQRKRKDKTAATIPTRRSVHSVSDGSIKDTGANVASSSVMASDKSTGVTAVSVLESQPMTLADSSSLESLTSATLEVQPSATPSSTTTILSSPTATGMPTSTSLGGSEAPAASAQPSPMSQSLEVTSIDHPAFSKTATVMPHQTPSSPHDRAISNTPADDDDSDEKEIMKTAAKQCDGDGDIEMAAVSTAAEHSPSLWYTEWLSYFSNASQDPKWVELLARWVRFESLNPPACKERLHNLPAKGRPEDVQWWIKQGKSFDNMPCIKKPAEFGVIWWGWWKNLQPSWRRIDDTDNLLREIPVDADWSCLLYGNSNGLAIVVMTLEWWLRAIEPAKLGASEHTPLFDAIADVGWVLEALATVIPTVKKGSALKRPSTLESVNKPVSKRSVALLIFL